MNSSKLSAAAAATAPANTAASVEGLAFWSPTGPAPVDVVTAEVTTEFQSLIEELLPDVIEPGLTAADSGDPGTTSDAPAQSANPDLATAQLLMQLPPLMPGTQPPNNAAPQALLAIDSGAAVTAGATATIAQAASVFGTLETEADGAADEPVPARGAARFHAAVDRPGRDGAGAWLTEGALPSVPLKLQEPADRAANPQGQHGERGAHAATPQSLPQVAAAVAAAAAAARELPSLPRMENPVGTAAWRQELANTVNLMIDRGEQSATLRLSPQHLGPLEVRIAIREGETSLWFGAAHADTRAALEQALPRLREQFASAGLSLGQSSVSQGSPQEPRNLRAAMFSGSSAAGSDSGEMSVPTGRATSRITGLIDTYV